MIYMLARKGMQRLQKSYSLKYEKISEKKMNLRRIPFENTDEEWICREKQVEWITKIRPMLRIFPMPLGLTKEIFIWGK